MQKKKDSIKKKAEIIFRIREFIRQIPYHLLVMGSVSVIAIIFNKYIEAVCFLISFFSLRYKFDTTYHSDSIVLCMVLTIGMFSLSIIICPPIYTYVFFCILFAYLDCFILWFIKDRKDQISQNQILDAQLYEVMCELKEYKKIDLFKMSEQELRQFAQSRGLSETMCDTLVLKIIHNYRWVDIQKQLNFSKDGIRYHKEKIIEKLNIEL